MRGIRIQYLVEYGRIRYHSSGETCERADENCSGQMSMKRSGDGHQTYGVALLEIHARAQQLRSITRRAEAANVANPDPGLGNSGTETPRE